MMKMEIIKRERRKGWRLRRFREIETMRGEAGDRDFGI
jgi:hypothetical protein